MSETCLRTLLFQHKRIKLIPNILNTNYCDNTNGTACDSTFIPKEDCQQGCMFDENSNGQIAFQDEDFL